VNFYKTGQELFEIMSRLEARMGVQSFFVMDENFCFTVRGAGAAVNDEGAWKAWSLYVFSSGRVLRGYSIEELIVWVSPGYGWDGGEDSAYTKLNGVDTREAVATLQSHGIRVLGSSIIGLENHTPENIDSVIDHAVSHATDFHQFMLYTPVPGTRSMPSTGSGNPHTGRRYRDSHGHFNSISPPHISREQSGEFLCAPLNVTSA